MPWLKHVSSEGLIPAIHSRCTYKIVGNEVVVYPTIFVTEYHLFKNNLTFLQKYIFVKFCKIL